MDETFRWGIRWVRADAAFVFALTLTAIAVTHGSWAQFALLLLVPDVSMLGYLVNSRVGAATYNIGHLHALPMALLVWAVTTAHTAWTLPALTWIAHIAMDQALGYGLKLPTAFKDTVLGRL